MNASDGINRRYVATLAVASVLVLVTGWLIRPRDDAQAPTPLPSERELARLARLAERQSLESMTAYFASVAEDQGASVVRAPSDGATALVWNEAVLVATRVRAGSEAPDGRWADDVPVTVRTLAPASGPYIPVHRRNSPIPTGAWVVAVWQTAEGRAFAMANVLQTAHLTCGPVRTDEVISSVPLTDTMVGGGLFDDEGSLLGMILPCDRRLAVVVPRGVDALLAHADTIDHRLVEGAGLAVHALDEDFSSYFNGTKGVAVSSVWTGSAADRAGLEPGDVIVTLDGAAVSSPGDLAPLTIANHPPLSVGLQRLRTTRLVTVTIPPVEVPSPRTGPAPAAGLIWPASHGVRVNEVIPASAAARAGIRSGDLVLAVDGVPLATASQANRLLSDVDSHPVFVTVARDGRRLGLLVH